MVMEVKTLAPPVSVAVKLGAPGIARRRRPRSTTGGETGAAGHADGGQADVIARIDIIGGDRDI